MGLPCRHPPPGEKGNKPPSSANDPLLFLPPQGQYRVPLRSERGGRAGKKGGQSQSWNLADGPEA
jgi:hypothetical protein